MLLGGGGGGAFCWHGSDAHVPLEGTGHCKSIHRFSELLPFSCNATFLWFGWYINGQSPVLNADHLQGVTENSVTHNQNAE